MLVATCNVNGIRAAVRKGMLDWVAQRQPDVLLLQEVRAPEELTAQLLEDFQVVQQASELKGRAGVAIAVRPGIKLGKTNIGLSAGLDDGGEPPVDTGRWVEAYLPEVDTVVVSAYLHSGVATDEQKMTAKYAHLDRVSVRLDELRAQHERVLVAGDFNIVHTELDIKNYKPNHNKTAGVLDREIAYLDDWFGQRRWVDVHRQLVGAEQGPYTWWSQRGRAFDNDAGWRIDYHMATAELAETAVSAAVDRADSYDTRWSDHAPLCVTYQLG